MSRQIPCVKCPKKGCGKYHDICEEYQTWVLEHGEEKKKIAAERDAKHTVNPSKEQAIRKSMKWK